MSPLRGNVAFASGMYDFCFTLDSFAKLYSDTHGNACTPEVFSKYVHLHLHQCCHVRSLIDWYTADSQLYTIGTGPFLLTLIRVLACLHA